MWEIIKKNCAFKKSRLPKLAELNFYFQVNSAGPATVNEFRWWEESVQKNSTSSKQCRFIERKKNTLDAIFHKRNWFFSLYIAEKVGPVVRRGAPFRVNDQNKKKTIKANIRTFPHSIEITKNITVSECGCAWVCVYTAEYWKATCNLWWTELLMPWDWIDGNSQLWSAHIFDRFQASTKSTNIPVRYYPTNFDMVSNFLFFSFIFSLFYSHILLVLYAI